MNSNSNYIKLGDAFLLETPPNGMHLYIAIVPTDNYRYLFINMSKRKPNSDISCILKPGLAVPNFITQESVVVYKYAREFSAEEISSLIESGVCQPKGSCSPNILYKIQMVGTLSKQIKNKYKKIIKEHLNLE